MSKVEEFGVSFSNTRNAHRGFDLTGPALDPTELEAPVYPIGAGIAKRTAMAYRPAYLNEDDIVLATCHHAHEVARAHGAKEVMLEHLEHALARVLPAAAVLEDRGIHVEALRRESAAVLASEIPVDNTVQLGQLKASRDFNTVMYLAAAGASHRDEKATGVRDVLDALLKYDPRSRAVRLVRKHATGSLEEAADPLSEMRTAMERYTTEMREVRLLAADIKTGQASQGIAVQNAIDLRLSQLERSDLSAPHRVKSLSRSGLLMSAAQQSVLAERQRVLAHALRTGQHGAAGALGARVAGHDAGKIGRLRVRAVELALGLVLLLLGDRLGRALRLLLRVGLLLRRVGGRACASNCGADDYRFNSHDSASS